MKRFNLIILTVVMSLLCISYTTTTKAKEMPSGVLFVNLPESSYEWQVLTSDRSIKVYNSEITNIKSTKKTGTIEQIDKTGIYVNTTDNLIKLTDIKLEGKKRCLVKDFINGIKIDEYLGKILK